MEEQQLVVFRIGSELYGIDIFRIHEIIRRRGITAIPGTPDHLLGLVNLRGKTVPVVDLGRLFGIDDSPNAEDSERIVVVESEQGNIGLMVDEVREVATVSLESIDEAPEMLVSACVEFIKGIAKRESELISVLDLDKALAA